MRFARFANAALGGNQDARAHGRNLFEHLSEDSLRDAIAINVGVIEEGVAGLIGGQHRAPPDGLGIDAQLVGVPRARKAPAAVSQAAAG